MSKTMEPVVRELDITEADAWAIADAAAAAVLPLLREGELTIDEYFRKHREKLVTRGQAQIELDKLVERGLLAKEKRRSPRGGSHVTVYVVPESERHGTSVLRKSRVE